MKKFKIFVIFFCVTIISYMFASFMAMDLGWFFLDGPASHVHRGLFLLFSLGGTAILSIGFVE